MSSDFAQTFIFTAIRKAYQPKSLDHSASIKYILDPKS